MNMQNDDDDDDVLDAVPRILASSVCSLLSPVQPVLRCDVRRHTESERN